MGIPAKARSHLAKAGRFLAAAERALAADLFDPAVVSAIACGIQCKDAVCLRVLGESRRARSHGHEVRDLKAAGPVGHAMAPHLSRLLALKPRAQYAHAAIDQGDATAAVVASERMYALAQEALAA